MEKPKLARVFWLSVLALLLCNVPNLSTVGILSLLSLTVDLNQSPGKAIAAEVRHWEYDPYTNELQVTSIPPPEYFILANPPRIVIDIPESSFGKNSIEESYPGLVRTIRISEFKPGQTRIVMDLDPRISLYPGQVQLEPLGQGNRWVLRPQIQLSETLPSLEATQTLPQLPGVNPPIGDRSETLMVPPLPTPTVPISSDVGLPTEQVISTDLPSDRTIAVTVPSIDELPPTAEFSSEETEIFVPPPLTNEMNDLPSVTVSESRSPSVSVPTDTEFNDEVTEVPTVTEFNEVTEVPTTTEFNEVTEVPTTTEFNEVTELPTVTEFNDEVTEVTQSLPPYSEWEEITPRESSSESEVFTPSEPPSAIASVYASGSASVSAIVFGEALPQPANPPIPVTAVNSTNLPNDNNRNFTREIIDLEAEILDPDVLVAAGTVIILRYAGSEEFSLKSGSSRREVLLVDADIYGQNGNIIAPVGTPAIGTFESDGRGIRFVVESIIINGEMVSLIAESEVIAENGAGGGLLSWSTLGAVGGAAIGGLAGGPLLGGAAAGVAANLLSSPSEAAIAPGQTIPVRAIEHWRLSN